MIRPITLITALMFVVSGAYLFVVKHRSQTLDDQLTMTAQATRLDAQRIRVLQAQWALEVDPSRLAQLSTQFLGTLQPMKPSQLMTLAELTSALPAPGSPVPGTNPEDAIPVTPEVPEAAVASAAPRPPRGRRWRMPPARLRRRRCRWRVLRRQRQPWPRHHAT